MRNCPIVILDDKPPFYVEIITQSIFTTFADDITLIIQSLYSSFLISVIVIAVSLQIHTIWEFFYLKTNTNGFHDGCFQITDDKTL